MYYSSSQTENHRPELKRWGWIALINTAIVIVGVIVWFLALTLLSKATERVDSARFGDLLTLFAVLVVPNILAGTAVGLAQWYSLWRNAISLVAWVVLSIIGWTFVFAIPLFVPFTSDDPLRDTLYVVVSRAVVAALIGIGQWLLLRKHVHDAGWWIPISTGATAVAWLGLQTFL